MGMCFAPGCNHYSQRGTCRFFRFPKNLEERRKWITSTRRKDKVPTEANYLCQCHFKDGKRENGPTIFDHNKDKYLDFSSPEKKPKRRKTTSAKCAEESSLSLPSTSSASSSTLPSVEQIEIDVLRREIENLKEENKKLKRQQFGFPSIEENEEAINYYTGLPNKSVFMLILSICVSSLTNYYDGWNVVAIDKRDQLLLTLMKLKRNYGHFDLGQRFGISQTTVTNTFLTWLYCLHEVLYTPLMEILPSQMKNELCLPSCFINFRNCRMVVDCTEFPVVRPKKMQHQRLFYSSYKHTHTVKGLIGVAPNGVITYASNMYPGSTSDKEVFKNSGIANLFQAGDLVIADKGFLITDLVPDGVSVNIPPFLFTPQFTPSQVSDTQEIARARIHVERAIRRIKLFKITHSIPKSLFPFASKIIQVCVTLTNFSPPLLKEVQHLY